MPMRALHILALFMLAALSPEAANAVQFSEQELRTAYLYNFALFTTWPANWSPENGNTMTLCTIGDDKLGTSIEQLHNRQIRSKRLVVRRAISLEQAPFCHMLYIAENERQNMAAILQSLRGSSVLTISDAPAGGAPTSRAAVPAASGAEAPAVAPVRSIITLILENRRLMFEVDSAAARQAGLTMSSRLLYLARHVY
jgi:hypothetical protein